MNEEFLKEIAHELSYHDGEMYGCYNCYWNAQRYCEGLQSLVFKLDLVSKHSDVDIVEELATLMTGPYKERKTGTWYSSRKGAIKGIKERIRYVTMLAERTRPK